MPIVAREPLKQFVCDLFVAAGAEQEEANVVADHLVDANLAGHDSHGVLRVAQYIGDINQGQIVAGSKLRWLSDWPTGAVGDAEGCFGQVACLEAMQRAIEKAKDVGLAAVTIKHANHSGRLGHYVEIAAAQGMIGWAFANGGGAGQWVAPFGGRERRLSTNPMAFAAPSAGEFPVVVDISTSVAPEGKVRDYRQRGQRTPAGWLVDAEGLPSSDPNVLYADTPGAILPLGGAAGHKGFGLAVLVDILAGGLSGAGCPTSSRVDSSKGAGLLFLAIDVTRYGRSEDFYREIQQMLEYLKTCAPAEGFSEVLVPGEREYRQRGERLAGGIDLPLPTWTALEELANQFEAGSGHKFIRPKAESLVN